RRATDRPTLPPRGKALLEQKRSLVMSRTSTKITIALLAVLAAPGASYARTAGEAGMGNVPISGIAPGPANAGGMNNVTVDPSGVGNASRIAPLPQPHIAAVAMARTGGSRNPAPPSSTNSGQQLLPDAPVGHRQPRADQ